MKNLLFILFTFFAFLSNAQKGKSLPADFYSCWAASYEDDRNEEKIKVYRSCDYSDFKPSFYRQRFVFRKDGTCDVLMIGETDAHYFLPCKWSYSKRKGTVCITEKTKNINIVFTVIKISKGYMELKMRETP